MNAKEREIFRRLMARYKDQWDRNDYNRVNYNSDLEYYLGYRNPQNYPLAYNESFNKILPIIYSLLSRFMSQMYQGGNIVSVKPRKQKDVQNRKAVEAVLNYQMDTLNCIDMQGGSYLTMMKWFFNAITFGKGIAKCYWRKEDRISPKRMLIQSPNFDSFGNFQGYDPIDYITQEMQTVYDGPYVEILHNKLCVPHPEYKSIQQMPAFFIVYKRSMDYIKRKVDKGDYDRRNFKEMGWESSGQAGVYARDSMEEYVHGLEIEGGLDCAEIDDPLTTKNVDIIEAYTRLILKDEPYEVGSGMKIKGLEEECIVHIGNYKTILSVQKNPYGIRPFFDIGCYMQPEMYWDVGLVRLTKGIQEQYNTLANLRMQNAMMLVNAMLRVDPDSDVDPQALIWKPFGIVPAMQGEVEPITIPDYNSNIFMEQQTFYEDAIQDLMGMYCLLIENTPDDYEILTDSGWKKFDDIDKNGKERVMTLNLDTEIMEWQKPLEFIEYPEKEYPCYCFKNQSAEFICSPEHRVPLISNGKKKIERIKDVPIDSYTCNSIPIAGFKWSGDNDWEPPFELISQDDWCSFMGIWIAEGCTSKSSGGYFISVSQDKKKNPDKYNQIEILLNRLPFDFRPDSSGSKFYTYDKEIYNYLKQFGKSADKYVPFEIKNSSPKLIETFIKWYLMGDGSIVRGEKRFTTISKRLADDIQEMVFKTGKRASIRFDDGHGRWAGEISENHRNTYLQGNKGQTAVTQKTLKGRMSCLRVPNGIFLIRKNSKPVWTGNSYGMGQTPQRQERVGVVYGIQAMGEARAKLMLMSMDYLGIQPLLKYMMLLNTFHLPSGFEYRICDRDQYSFGQIFGSDIHPDFDFQARYTSMEPALGKQARADRLVQLAGMWQQNPWINQFQMTKVIMELMDIWESDSLIKTPQMMQQEMQQQQQTAMMMEAQKHQFETKGKLMIGQQEVQGEMALNEQEFGHDLVIESMKANAALEQAKERKQAVKTK